MRSILRVAMLLPLCFLALSCKQEPPEVTGAFGWRLGEAFDPGKYGDRLSETNGVRSITYYDVQDPSIAPFDRVVVKATVKDNRIISIIADMPRQQDVEKSRADVLNGLARKYALIEKSTNAPYVETYEFGGKEKVVTAIVFDDGIIRLHYRLKSMEAAMLFQKNARRAQEDTVKKKEMDQALGGP